MNKWGLVLVLLSTLSAVKAEQEWSEDWGDSWQDTKDTQLFQGFIEYARGQKIQPATGTNESLNELRARIEWQDTFKKVKVEFKADAYYDALLSKSEGGEIRELNALIPLGEQVELTLGRQILTWGTGDYLFINDLFPKDWQSFFIGRDDEYLKAPSDAVKLDIFSKHINFNLVYSPQFDSDRYIDGTRLSFYLPGSGILQPDGLNVQRPDDNEVSLRAYGKLNAIEWAVYGYRGFFNSPEGINTNSELFFPRLRVLGASLRTTIGAGVGHIELGSFASLDDTSGNNPNIPNSRTKLLLGYEQELVTNLTAGLQWQSEKIADVTAPTAALEPSQQKWQNLLTLRLRHQALQQKLTNNLFIFYSPTDRDHHLRLSSQYRYDDHWSFTLGLMWFEGKTTETFWAQFQENNNVYFRTRYNF